MPHVFKVDQIVLLVPLNCTWQTLCECVHVHLSVYSCLFVHLCEDLVVFSVCASSAVRFPVLPPPTLPSSLFPRSDLEEEKQRIK